VTRRTLTLTYEFEAVPETSEPDGAPADTGAILVTVATALSPQGYTVALPAGSSDWQIAAAIESLWANQGRPA
jgi:hypothetical protein